jgi:hypothetical protein
MDIDQEDDVAMPTWQGVNGVEEELQALLLGDKHFGIL